MLVDCLLRWHTANPVRYNHLRVCNGTRTGRLCESCIHYCLQGNVETIVNWSFIMNAQSSVCPTNGQWQPRHGVSLSLWYTYIRIYFEYISTYISNYYERNAFISIARSSIFLGASSAA